MLSKIQDKWKGCIYFIFFEKRKNICHNRGMEDLQKIRDDIDETDREIIRLLVRRCVFSEKVSKIKQKEGLPVFDGKREIDLLKEMEEYSQKLGMSAEFTKPIFQEILHQSRRLQEIAMKNKEAQ
jgi:chorismate mutase